MYKDKIKEVESSMEKNFRNYDGGGYNGFNMPDTYNYATGAQNQGLSRMNPNSSIVTLVLTNTTTDAKTITILNAGAGTTPSTDSIPEGCAVNYTQGSYSGLLTRVSQKPFLIQGLKLKVKDQSQFDNPITCGYDSNMGSGTFNTLTLEAYGSMYQNVQTKLDIPSFRYTVDIDSYVSVSVNGSSSITGGERLTLTFFLTAQVQPGRIFVGEDATAVNPDAYISGLPTVVNTINVPAMDAAAIAQKRMV